MVHSPNFRIVSAAAHDQRLLCCNANILCECLLYGGEYRGVDFRSVPKAAVRWYTQFGRTP